MSKFTLTLLAAAMMSCGTVPSFAASKDVADIAKFAYKCKNNSNVFQSERMQRIEAANAMIDAGKPSRFAYPLTSTAQSDVAPDHEFKSVELHGDIDGPNGQLWFYTGHIEYDIIKYEYFTDKSAKSFSFDIYDSNMKLVGSVADAIELKEDETRAPKGGVSILPIITKNYFNSDDKYEVSVAILVNPKSYGVRAYTYVYSLGGNKDTQGYDIPVMELNGIVSDVCDASDAETENVVMTFMSEGNDSDVTEDDLADRYWDYQMGNYLAFHTYAKAGADGNLQKVFEKRITTYQYQGDQQDIAPMMTMVHNGKPTIIFPYYEEVFYNRFDSFMDDMSMRLPNNLVIDIYELDDISAGFTLKQTTKIAMEKSDASDAIASYYGVGAFDYTNDVMFGNDGKASFIVTRSDYVASSDAYRNSYYFYNSDGTLARPFFENVSSHTALSDIKGHSPMHLFITVNNMGEYIFNFMDMTTMDVELSLNYGLLEEGSDEPDYMMANIDRVKVGDTFMYVAEMRMPEYDDINDINFMRAVWLTREGNVDHMDYINMGNMVNYATLFINSVALDANYFHYSPEHEYMMLIKRAFSDSSTKTEEQLLIGQAKSKAHPQGQDLLLLGYDDQLGGLNTIIPYTDPNRLSVTYLTAGSDGDVYSTVYYDLPFNKDEAGIDHIYTDTSSGYAFDGRTVTLEGATIEVYNLQGICVATGYGSVELTGLGKGLYLVSAGGYSGKIALK